MVTIILSADAALLDVTSLRIDIHLLDLGVILLLQQSQDHYSLQSFQRRHTFRKPPVDRNGGSVKPIKLDFLSKLFRIFGQVFSNEGVIQDTILED